MELLTKSIRAQVWDVSANIQPKISSSCWVNILHTSHYKIQADTRPMVMEALE